MSKPPPRIADVTRSGPTSLDVRWCAGGPERCAGGSERVDLAGWIATGGPALAPLKDRRLFAAARPDGHGTAVVWGEAAGDPAIDAHHLWRIAAEQRAFGQGDVAAWQAEIGLSNPEAAEFLGISLSAWNTYKAGTNRVPEPVAIVCRAALRDPLLLQARYRPRKAGRPRRLEA